MDRALNIFRTYFLPAFVIQSVLLAGGFGTGREIVEYFTSHGAVGGLLGLFVAFLLFALIIGLTFERSQRFSLYNYQDFFVNLIGRFSFIFEIVYVLTLVLVMSIVGSAAGTLLEETFSIPYYAGVLSLYLTVCVISFLGVEFVNRFLTLATLVVYLILSTVIIVVFTESFDAISVSLDPSDIQPTWPLFSAKFALYNLAAVPGLLYSTRSIDSPKKAWLAACIAAAIIVIPGVMIHLVLLSGYPEVTSQELPVFWVLNRGGHAGLTIAYILMLVITLCATVSGLIQGLTERISAFLKQKGRGEATHLQSLSICLVAITMSMALSTVGFVTLVAEGYSILAYCILAVYVVPLLFSGAKRMLPAKSSSRIP